MPDARTAMTVELRRTLISDAYGDWEFLREPSKTAPDLIAISQSYSQDAETPDRWRRSASGATFAVQPFGRTLRLQSASLLSVHHYAPASLLPVKVRISYHIATGPVTFELGNPDTQDSQTIASGDGSVELSASTPGSRWRLTATINGAGANRDARLRTVRLWEYCDLEPWLDGLATTEASATVVTKPILFSFKGSHFVWTDKSVELTLLVPTSESLFLSQLDDLLSVRSPHRYPLELFVDGFVWRCAAAELERSSAGGPLLRLRLRLTLQAPFAKSETDTFSSASGTSLPLQLTLTLPSQAAETPVLVGCALASGASPAAIRFTAQPSNSSVTFAPDIINAPVTYFLHTDTVLWSGTTDDGVITNKTHLIRSFRNLPLTLLPGINTVTMEFLDNTGNQIITVPNTVTLALRTTEQRTEVILA
ncbi:MAG: hypothetical protein NZ959_10400 [Armatimonadetes bacterium]|nr:hypothetical protein [Armatimonadota bacterium]MDW8122705.1 hypothetical protein [Armatimonadota bacterium]